MIPFIWTLEGDSEFVKGRMYMIPLAVVVPLFSVIRIMERRISSERPKGVFSCGDEREGCTLLTADVIFDLLRSFNCERVT